MQDPAVLRQWDAHLLAHAMCSSIGKRTGIRVLAIKGWVTSDLGMRKARVPADVDILIEPSGFAAYMAAMEAAGWAERPSSAEPRRNLHAVTVVHPEWPCDIDIHLYFPGILRKSDQAFEFLWQHRVAATVAHCDVSRPDLPAATIVTALNLLRHPTYRDRDTQELKQLVDFAVARDDKFRADVLATARELDALDTTRPFLTALNAPLPTSTPRGARRDLDEWRAVVGSGGAHAIRILVESGSETSRAALRALIAQAVAPRYPAEALAQSSRRTRILWRIKHIARAWRSLPRVARGLAALNWRLR